ncbi:GAF and ANTAR domain-containing protein [Arthrobacter sp. efr-133-R2A-63]|uniref:GAF and ANTAR domain-containing protein n=1 Tax=Arthrobacter sp. efr-133-R2A-63 TaxID=3040278 RepID=UPI00254EDACA|nr:GAF and ANTAR domain-containing protein [Arthrobacter sp. efr-133-R2A-63]
MSSSPENEAAGLLQGILDLQSVLAGSENVSEFLTGLTKLAAASISEASDDEIECAITVKVRRRPLTAAGSSSRAVEIDRFEQAIGDGPCIAALREMSPVIIEDDSTDLRWPALTKKFAEVGVHSSLGIPMEISEEASAALNFFASKPGAFTPDVFDKAVGFAAAARNILHLSVRIDSAHHRAQNLESAMQSRTAIDVACGVIMAQNRCSQSEAMAILTKVSSNRNRKLRDVATELIEQLSGNSIETHFEA